MQRIITERDDNGVPTQWHDCPEVEKEDVSYADCDRFDDEVGEVPRLGVRGWTEVVWVLDDLRLQLLGKAAELSDAGADDEELWKWLEAHPRFRLSQVVATWAALAVAGHKVTVAEVYRLPRRDVLHLNVKEPEDRKPGKSKAVPRTARTGSDARPEPSAESGTSTPSI